VQHQGAHLPIRSPAGSSSRGVVTPVVGLPAGPAVQLSYKIIQMYNERSPSIDGLPASSSNDDDASLSPNALDHCRSLKAEDLVHWLTEERFFEPFSDNVKVKFAAAEVPGEMFVMRCWDAIFNRDILGLPAGPAVQLWFKILQVYSNAGMSSVLVLLSTSY
jgi:hypothetical protein